MLYEICNRRTTKYLKVLHVLSVTVERAKELSFIAAGRQQQQDPDVWSPAHRRRSR